MMTSKKKSEFLKSVKDDWEEKLIDQNIYNYNSPEEVYNELDELRRYVVFDRIDEKCGGSIYVPTLSMDIDDFADIMYGHNPELCDLVKSTDLRDLLPENIVMTDTEFYKDAPEFLYDELNNTNVPLYKMEEMHNSSAIRIDISSLDEVEMLMGEDIIEGNMIRTLKGYLKAIGKNKCEVSMRVDFDNIKTGPIDYLSKDEKLFGTVTGYCCGGFMEDQDSLFNASNIDIYHKKKNIKNVIRRIEELQTTKDILSDYLEPNKDNYEMLIDQAREKIPHRFID